MLVVLTETYCNKVNMRIHSHIHTYMRAVRKAYSHFEYLKNWSCGLDATYQPARGTLLHIREQSLSRGASG